MLRSGVDLDLDPRAFGLELVCVLRAGRHANISIRTADQHVDRRTSGLWLEILDPARRVERYMQGEAEAARQGAPGATLVRRQQRDTAALGEAEDSDPGRINARMGGQRLQCRERIVGHFLIGYCRLIVYGAGNSPRLERIQHERRYIHRHHLPRVTELVRLFHAAATMLNDHRRHFAGTSWEKELAGDLNRFAAILTRERDGLASLLRLAVGTKRKEKERDQSGRSKLTVIPVAHLQALLRGPYEVTLLSNIVPYESAVMQPLLRGRQVS